MIVADIQNLSNLLARGEIDACICYPDLSARELRDGSVRPLYDGKSSADLFAELDAPGHDGPMGNVFVARKDWVDAHPAEVSAFLDLWDRGLAEWQAHRDEMIERYPQHFAVSTPEDIAFMKAYVADHDWVVDEVRFDPQWAEDESSIFDLMRATGVIGDGVTDPEVPAHPRSPAVTQTVALPDAPPAPPPAGRRTRRGSGATLRWLASGAALLLALAAWAAVAAWIDDPIVPRPAGVAEQVVAIVGSGEALTNFTASIAKIAAGFAIAMAGGLVIGFAMGRSTFMTSYFSLPLFVLGNMPGLTYAVFGLLIFGVGAGGPIVVSALVALPFIAINVAEGCARWTASCCRCAMPSGAAAPTCCGTCICLR